MVFGRKWYFSRHFVVNQPAVDISLFFHHIWLFNSIIQVNWESVEMWSGISMFTRPLHAIVGLNSATTNVWIHGEELPEPAAHIIHMYMLIFTNVLHYAARYTHRTHIKCEFGAMISLTKVILHLWQLKFCSIKSDNSTAHEVLLHMECVWFMLSRKFHPFLMQ